MNECEEKTVAINDLKQANLENHILIQTLNNSIEDLK